MARATLPVCEWCLQIYEHELYSALQYRPKQDCVLRTVNGTLHWLHLQCESPYRHSLQT